MNWDTIKLFLALYREGSARSVAEKLALSASTVTRRITELESNLDTKLFIRHTSGFKLTEAGEELLHIALRMENDAYEIERKLLAKQKVMSGAIRITIPYHFMTLPFMQCVKSFSSLHPAVDIEVIPSWEAFKLDRGDADMAIRLMYKDSCPPENLIGVKLANIYCAVYGSKSYIQTHDLADAASASFIGWDDGMYFPDWVTNSDFPNIPARHQLADPLMQVYAAKAGLGVAMLPCFLCDIEDDLVRIPSDKKWHRFDIWLLSHPDLRDTSRFKEMRKHIKTYFSSTKSIWEGEQ